MNTNNLAFLKNLITSDFSSVNTLFLKQNGAPLSATVGFSKQQIHGNLDLLILNRSLKQFIRVLQFFNRKPGIFRIFLRDTNFSTLLSGILARLIKTQRLLVLGDIKKSEGLLSGRRQANPALLLDRDFFAVNCSKRLYQNKSYLKTSMDLIQNVLRLGGYHIQVDTLSPAQRSFIGLVLANVLRLPVKARKRTLQQKKNRRAAVKMKTLIKELKESARSKKQGVRKTTAPLKKKIKTRKNKKHKQLVSASIKLDLLAKKKLLSSADCSPFKKKPIEKLSFLIFGKTRKKQTPMYGDKNQNIQCS